MACMLNYRTLLLCQLTDVISGSSFLTTARTVSPPTFPCGSTVSRRRRCKQFIQCEAVRSGAEGAESVSKSCHRVSGHERYPKTSMSNTVDTTIGNNLGLCLSHFHLKVNLSLFFKSTFRCDAGIRPVPRLHAVCTIGHMQCAHTRSCNRSSPLIFNPLPRLHVNDSPRTGIPHPASNKPTSQTLNTLTILSSTQTPQQILLLSNLWIQPCRHLIGAVTPPSMDLSRLGAAQTTAPSPPQKIRGADIDKFIRSLHTEFGLDIPLPGGEYLSPARQKDVSGGALLIRIQFIYYKDKSGLDQAIEEFRQDPRARNCSPQSATRLLFERLNDLYWISKNRIITPPRPTKFTPSTSYSTPSSSLWPQIARFDSGASRDDTQSDGMPPSPLSRKFKGGVEIKAGNRAQQQMPDASSNYGSPWEDHWLEDEKSMETTRLDFSKTLDGLNGTATPTAHAAKRRKINNHKTEAITGPAEEAQANAAGEHRLQNCQWQIRDMVKNGFGTRYAYEIDARSPFVISVERARLRQDAGLDEALVSSATSHEDVEEMLKSQDIEFKQSSPSIWNPLSQTGGGSLAGTISLNPKSGDKQPLFQMRLHPIVFESSRIERRFGSDRFLKVTLPSLNKHLPQNIPSDALNAAFEDWLQAPKVFLGRTWSVFDTKELKSKSSSKQVHRVNNSHLKHRDVYFFATNGLGITSIPISIPINWLYPMEENADVSFCKGFSRITLSDRKTQPTVCFKPSQVLMIDDIIANAELEDTTFDDPAFQGRPRKMWSADEVMTDGCAMISVGAALLIRETAGVVDFPSAFQGRINGHKGMWHVSGSYETSNPRDLGVWIELRPSQRKVIPRAEDLSDEQCEPNKWSFDLVGLNKPVSHSSIHKDFLPVLADRGVSRGALHAVIGDAIRLPIEDIREAMQDVGKFTVWSQETSGRDCEDQPDKRRGLLPLKSFSKCQVLINKIGYTPSTNHIVAKSAVQMAEAELQRQRLPMSFACIQSTSVHGIADPYGVLKPGEVHFSLSRPLVHEISQQRFDIFAGKDVLITRDPIIRGSDMQKVHCVCHPKLVHLKNLIVMPSRGQIPLAAKLQGGDYDGDTFWVCADERLVEPFRNVPVLRQATVEELGIGREKRTLRDLVDEKDIGTGWHVQVWFKHVVPFCLRESQLGVVTNYLYMLIYYYNDLWHPHVMLVSDLHDTIIDADKNGYIFDGGDWVRFRRHHKLPKFSALQLKVKYSENLKAAGANVEAGKEKTSKPLREIVSEGSAKGGSHILDDIVFNVINPKYREILYWLDANVLEPVKEIRRDLDLEFPLRELQAQAARAVKAGKRFPIDVNEEVKAFKTTAEKVSDMMKYVWHKYRTKSESTRDVNSVSGLLECIELYKAIQPTQDWEFWDIRMAETAPTKWECFKVAVLASPGQFERRKSLLFWAALDVIQYLKSHSENGRRVIESVQAVLKPKRPKQSRNSLVKSTKPNELANGDDGDTTDDDDYDDDAAGLDRALLESFGS